MGEIGEKKRETWEGGKRRTLPTGSLMGERAVARVS